MQIEDVDAGKKIQHNSDEHSKPRFGSDDLDIKKAQRQSDETSVHREEIIHPNEEKSVISAPLDRTYSYLMPDRPIG